MARGEEPGSYNLAVGEPFVIQDSLGACLPSREQDVPIQSAYPRVGGERELLRKLHGLHGDDCHIVVACGAKQALAASMSALRTARNKHYVHHEAPYWPSYPTIAKQAGLGFVSKGVAIESDLTCVTSPNNPNGSVMYDGSCDIWDAVYAHPPYGYASEQFPDALIEVRSAAKMFGLSGIRVGWLVTKDEELAQLAAQYVEAATSGVSVPAQLYLARSIDHYRERVDIKRHWDAAWRKIQLNGKIFMENLGRYCETISGVPTGNPGMFAWFRIKPMLQPYFAQALEDCRVRLVTGEACGMQEPGWYRMSMGHRPWYTAEALVKLASAMKGFDG